MRRHKKPETTTVIGIVLIAGLFGGCNPEYERLSITPRTDSPVVADVGSQPIILTEGTAV